MLVLVRFTLRRRQHAWPDVRRRLELAVSRRPQGVRRFVVRRLERTKSPTVVAGLTRHPHSRDVVRDHVALLLTGRDAGVARRLRANPGLAGAFAGAANLLLDEDGARAAYGWVSALEPDRLLEAVAVLDSMGARPRQRFDGPAYTELMKSGGLVPPNRNPVRHRLVITEQLKDLDALSLLLPDADRTTVFATSDATGKASFDVYRAWPGVGDVTVEHFRSRISRFSREYVAIHEATAQLGSSVARATLKLGAPLRAGDRSDLELAVADFLHFQTLRIAAIEMLLDDEHFDHVVIAVDDQEVISGYVQLLAAIARIREDPRVEIVSISGSDPVRADFLSVLAELSLGQQQQPAEEKPASPLDWGEVLSAATELASELGEFDPEGQRPRALLVTSTNPAYNRATVDYAAFLAESYELRILHPGAYARRLRVLLNKRIEEVGVAPIDRLVPPRDLLSPLGDGLTSELRRLTEPPTVSYDGTLDVNAIAWLALRALLRQVSHLVVLPHLKAQLAMYAWFTRLAEGSVLPAVVVVVPNRMVGVSSIVSVARAFQVPSVAVEPHMQDANYCRYAKVFTDYYGVVSEYFRHSASEGFGIDLDRVVTVGTPRLVAPEDYDPRAAQIEARERLEFDSGVRLSDDVAAVFFAQPSSWTHVARIWRSVLEAGARTGVRVLLKPHPEESPSRVNRYLTTDGAGDVVVLQGSAEDAVALADVVLTTYSASAIDAVLQRTPVICVGDGDERYPVDISAIVDAPLARSVEELTELLEEFKADPTILQARARRLLEHEPQFVEGPAPRFNALVARAIEGGADGIRAEGDLPSSRFLDGPHPTFSV